MTYNVCKLLSKPRAIIAFATLLLLLSQSLLAQTVKVINGKMPSVYLVYDSKTKIKSRCNVTGEEFVILQLHNNTNVHINVSANFDADLESGIVDGSFNLPDGASAKTLESGSEVELCYDVEGTYVQKGYSIPRKARTPRVIGPGCLCSYLSNAKHVEYPQNIGYWIKPDEFIKFGVPLTFLRKNLKVYTEFNYPWEFEDGRLFSNEPRHKVYFYYFDMPDYVK